MQRRLTVTRIFPLGQYKNIQYTNELILENEELEDALIQVGGNIAGLYDNLTHEIYTAMYQHAKQAIAWEVPKDVDDKYSAYLKSRNEALKIKEE